VPAPALDDAPLPEVVRAATELDERHVALVARSQPQRAETLAQIAHALHDLPETQIVTIKGARVTDLRSFRAELDRALPDAGGRTLKPSFDGPGGVLARLREPPRSVEGHHVKRRYYLWSDADTLLAASPASFGVCVDAIVGVAAEAEFASDDLLLIHRLVLVGGPALHRCAQDAKGPLANWRPASTWARVTGVAAPSFATLLVGP
jgi:hypothetical protein